MPELLDRVSSVLKSTFDDEDVRARLLYFVDAYRSFEGWLNWEIAFRFANEKSNRWPEWTAQRENRYEGGGLADVVFHKGTHYDAKKSCHLESKLIWANGNAGKMASSAERDYQRLMPFPGSLLLLVGAAASVAKDEGLRVENPRDLINKVSSLLSVATRQSEVKLLDLSVDKKAKGKFYLGPRVAASLFYVR